jgi:cyclohexanecarboxyl-CoA dehydrogenase
MISFEFSEEQQQFREALADFSRKRLLPGYAARAALAEYPWKEHRSLAEMGVLGIGLPEEFGGTGAADFISLGIACEEIGYGDVNCGVAPVQTGLIGHQLAAGGTRGLQERWLPRLINGDVLVAIALTEPDSGSDAAAMRTVATPQEGGYRLSGEKTAVSLIPFAEAVIVYARAPGTTGHTGVSAFLVECDWPGVSIGRFNDMGALPLGRGTLALDEVFVPTDHLLGAEGRGFALVMGHFDYSRAGIALQCLGAARASLDEASAYSRERTAFGRPIAAFQGISFQIAQHYTYLEACRWLAYWTLWLRQHDRQHTSQAAMCKWWAPRIAVDAMQTALLVHGHVAYADELPLQQRLRDTFAYLIADGTAEMQKLIIGREYIGPEVVAR